MRIRKCKLAILLKLFVLCIVIAAGCSAKEDTMDKNQKGQVSHDTDDSGTEEDAETIIDGLDNVEVQGSMQGTTYVSKTENITITLPDADWRCESDTEDCVTFSSDDGMMNIIRMDGAEAVRTSMFHNAEEYLAYLRGTNPNLEGEVSGFETMETEGKESFLAVFHYTGENEFRYVVTYGIDFSDYCYMISAMLRTEDEAVLEATRTSIRECRINE